MESFTSPAPPQVGQSGKVQATKEVRQQNRFVLFCIAGVNDDTEAIGAQDIPSSPVDHGRQGLSHQRDAILIEAERPLANPLTPSSFRRIMIAQYSGSVDRGVLRSWQGSRSSGRANPAQRSLHDLAAA